MEIRIEKLYRGFLIVEQSDEPVRTKKYGAESGEETMKIIKSILGIIEKSVEPVQEQLQNTLGLYAPVPNILKQDILFPRFKYDHSLRKSIPDYKNTWYVELQDGRVVLGYGESSYYTTKESVMKIPFPVPYGYFKESEISTTAITCLRAYRQTFAKSLIKTAFCEKAGKNEDEIDLRDEEKPEGNESGSCDDITFDSCANNSPEICKFCVNESRFEDKNKIAASKPKRPLLKATIGL